jgi:hypothetical protein
MSELSLNPGHAAASAAGDKRDPLPLSREPERRRGAPRARRRAGVLQLAPLSDGFRPFRVY